MLLNFKISGFSSFFHPQELLLLSSPGSKIKNTRFERNFALLKRNKIMKSAIILGENASGKTNLVSALEKTVDLILYGSSSFCNERDLAYFSFDSKEVSVEISISGIDNSTYTYSIKYDNNFIILEESLFKNEKLFFRFKNNILTFGKEDKKREILSRLLSKESKETILHKLKDFNLKAIEIFRESIKKIIILNDSYFNSIENISIFEFQKIFLEENIDKVNSILKTFDPSIETMKFKEIDEGVFKPYFLRENLNHSFLLDFESKGLKKLTLLLCNLINILFEKTLVIDDLDSSLSYQGLNNLFETFIHKDCNTKGQLIGLCHNNSFINSKHFNSQQIFLIKKNQFLYSELRKNNYSQRIF